MNGSNEIIIGATNTQFIDGDRSARYPKREEYVDSGIMFLNGESISRGTINKEAVNFITEQKYRDIKKGRIARNDILLTTRGNSIGDAAFVTTSDKGLINAQMLILRVDSKDIHPKYLYYYITSNSLRNYILNFSSGSAQPQIPIRDLKKIPIYLPKTQVQRKIAAILSTYDELIENNQRRIALLEKMAEEIYREWFVRLRFPGHEKVKVIKGVPEGWRDQKFFQFCQLQRGFDLTNAEVEPGPYPVIASTSIKTYHSQYKVEPPVITTGRSGSLGEVLFINTKAWPHNTALYVKNFFGNSAFLVYYTLKNMRLENFNAGAGVPTLNRNHLNGIPIIVPSKELQDRFDEVVSKLHTQGELLRNTNHKLVETRDMLLPRLISGKLSVEHLDIQFPPGMEESNEH